MGSWIKSVHAWDTWMGVQIFLVGTYPKSKSNVYATLPDKSAEFATLLPYFWIDRKLIFSPWATNRKLINLCDKQAGVFIRSGPVWMISK